MPICSFSGKEIPPGTGIMYVRKDGKVLWFLNSKAEKNYVKLGRKPRSTAWTQEAITAKRTAAGQKRALTAEQPKAGPSKKSPEKAVQGEDV